MDLRQPSKAEEFVRSQMADQPERLSHLLVVADRARETALAIAAAHPGTDLDPNLVYCAALLHDIGYAPCARSSGFHPLDGAVYLQQQGYDDLAELVVGHSCSPEEAQLLGHTPIGASGDLAAKLITFWDMQVKQGGEIVSYEERLADILCRCGADSLIGRANLLAEPRIRLIFAEIQGLLKGPNLSGSFAGSFLTKKQG